MQVSEAGPTVNFRSGVMNEETIETLTGEGGDGEEGEYDGEEDYGDEDEDEDHDGENENDEFQDYTQG